jgi:hypothetical protein
MTFKTISDLSTVTGGAETRNQLLLDALNKRFGDQGVVSFDGRPKYSGSHARGVVDINALWGGDVKRSFNANVDVAHQRVTGLRTKALSAE